MAKKSFGQDDDPISGGADKATAMGRPTLHEVDAAIYGRVEDSGRQVAKPILLENISPDPTQPRREVPSIVRKRAKEDGVPEWETWHRMAEHQAGHEIPLKALLRGEGEGAEHEKTGMPLVDGFMALVALAASIHEKGLVNPITVSPRGMDHYMIETGERRYQAYKLLHGVLNLKKFSKIVANTVEQVDVWRQAAENGSRKPLNAIGMARQIALLIMALNTDKDYAPFEAFEGKCDREFYAQVADGVIHRIPKGESEKILQATGLKSRSQIQNYRGILDAEDSVWEMADEEDWTENRIREIVRPRRDMSSVDDISTMNPRRYTLTAVNVSTPSDAFGRPVYPPMTVRKGEGPGTKATKDKVLYRGEVVEYHNSDARGVLNGFNVLIMHFDHNEIRTFSEVVHSRDIKDLPHPDAGKPTGGFPSQQGTPFVQPKITYDAIGQGGATRLEVGQRRMNSSGRIIEILSILANDVAYAEISPATGRPMGRFVMTIAYAASLPIVSKDVLPSPQVPDEDHFDKDAAQAAIMGPDDDADESGDNPLSTQTPLPEWASVGRLVRDVERALAGKVISSHWSDKAGWNVRVGFEDHVSTIPLTALEPHEAEILNELPSWAVKGAPVMHMGGDHCEIIDQIYDVMSGQWLLKVMVLANGGEETAVITDFMPITGAREMPTPEPRPRHPSLAQLSGVIIEEQRQLRHLSETALAFGLKDEARDLASINVTTPNHARERLNTLGKRGAIEYAQRRYQMAYATYMRGIEISYRLMENEIWVIEDLDADQERIKE